MPRIAAGEPSFRPSDRRVKHRRTPRQLGEGADVQLAEDRGAVDPKALTQALLLQLAHGRDNTASARRRVRLNRPVTRRAW